MLKGGITLRTYFHFTPQKDKKRLKKLLFCTAALCGEICIAAFFVLIFNLITAANSDVIFQVTGIICGVILTGMIICLAAAEFSYKKIRRNSRYTYFDIQLKFIIFSYYGGEYTTGGERIIVRDLYYIPLSGFKSVTTDKKGKEVILSGDFRHYCMNSENLGYHVKNGEIVFDREWLNIGGFEKVESIRIPRVFGNSDRLIKSINFAVERYNSLPKPKPYVFKEADFIRRRAKPRYLPEDFGFERKW